MATSNKKVREEKKYTPARQAAAGAAGGGFTSRAYKTPNGVNQFKFDEKKTYRLAVLPFTAENNPDADPGAYTYYRKYNCHTNVGPQRDTFVCLQKEFNKRCPVCERAAELKLKGASDETLKELWPKTRHLYYVYDYDNKGAGIQLFETAFFKMFGQLLREKIEETENDDFYRLDESGSIVKVQTMKDEYNKNVFYKPVDITFAKRANPIDPKIEAKLDKLPSLDSLIQMVSYEELKAALLGEDVDEDGPKKTATGKKKGKPVDDEDEIEDEEIETTEDEEDEIEDDEEPTEDEDEETEDEDEDDGVDLKKGMMVSFSIRGKLKQGKVVKIDEKNSLVHVDIGAARPAIVDAAEINLVEDEEPTEDEDEDADDEEAFAEEEIEDEDDEEVKDEDTDDEEAFDDEDGEDEDDEETFDDEEEAPKKKGTPKGKPKPAPKKKGHK